MASILDRLIASWHALRWAWSDPLDLWPDDPIYEDTSGWYSSLPACPDTEPTSPGALDSDLQRLE